MKTADRLNKAEMMSKDISDSIAHLIDIQELAAMRGLNNMNLISQEAGKIIESLNTLEGLFPDGNCKDCGGELDNSDKCDDPLCDLRGKTQH